MRNRKFLSVVFTTLMLVVAMNSCKKDDKTAINLTSLKAGTIDLNSATAPNNVPVNSAITATFSTDVDQTTATSSNIVLLQDYDQTSIPLNISVTGSTVTITPSNPLGSGTLYKLSFKPGLKASNGEVLSSTIDRTFTTEGTFVPAGQFAYWSFEDSPDDVVGSYDPPSDGIVDITYVASRKAAAGKAANFNGTTSIIEIPNGDVLMNTPDFSLSFWLNAVSTDHPQGHFVMGLGAFHGFQFEIAGDYTCKLAASYEVDSGKTSSTDLWFPGDGKTKDNGGDVSWTFSKDMTSSGGVASLLKDKWAHVVCTYNSATKVGTMYINGDKMKEQDFNLKPDTDPLKKAVGLKYGGVAPEVVNKLAFGFIQSRDGTLWDTEPWGGYDLPGANHFKGQLDDVRIFHKALSQAEVGLIYNSEKP